MEREVLVYVHASGQPRLAGRLWARTRKNGEPTYSTFPLLVPIRNVCARLSKAKRSIRCPPKYRTACVVDSVAGVPLHIPIRLADPSPYGSRIGWVVLDGLPGRLRLIAPLGLLLSAAEYPLVVNPAYCRQGT